MITVHARHRERHVRSRETTDGEIDVTGFTDTVLVGLIEIVQHDLGLGVAPPRCKGADRGSWPHTVHGNALWPQFGQQRIGVKNRQGHQLRPELSEQWTPPVDEISPAGKQIDPRRGMREHIVQTPAEKSRIIFAGEAHVRTVVLGE